MFNYFVFECQISIFENNGAINGGSLYFSYASIIILKGSNYENSKFIKCFATNQGGSIYGEVCNFTIENFYFNNSIASIDGGAIY